MKGVWKEAAQLLSLPLDVQFKNCHFPPTLCFFTCMGNHTGFSCLPFLSLWEEKSILKWGVFELKKG